MSNVIYGLHVSGGGHGVSAPRLGLVRGAAGSLAARKCFGNATRRPGFWCHLAVSSNTTGAARTSVVQGNVTQKNKITLIFLKRDQS